MYEKNLASLFLTLALSTGFDLYVISHEYPPSAGWKMSDCPLLTISMCRKTRSGTILGRGVISYRNHAACLPLIDFGTFAPFFFYLVLRKKRWIAPLYLGRLGDGIKAARFMALGIESNRMI